MYSVDIRYPIWIWMVFVLDGYGYRISNSEFETPVIINFIPLVPWGSRGGVVGWRRHYLHSG